MQKFIVFININKIDNESIKDYTIRLFKNKEEYNLDCDAIATLINEVSGENKGSSAYRKWWKPYSEGYDDGYNDAIDKSDGDAKAVFLKLKELVERCMLE